MTMRHYNLAQRAPLYRTTVGFDQIADLMDRVLTADTSTPSYPPYNIEKTADDAWRISIAVAGFTDADLSIEQRIRSQGRGHG
jgi:molecular chaperone IbpA